MDNVVMATIIDRH